MLRLMLTDDMWLRVRPALYKCGVYEKKRLRIIVEGILWRMRIGSPWRDLPTEFGPWKTIYNQFNRWSRRGILERLFFILRGELDKEWHFMDASIVKAHQHSIGVNGSSPQNQGIGKTAGGNTTKVHMLCDSQRPSHGEFLALVENHKGTLYWVPPGVLLTDLARFENYSDNFSSDLGMD